MNTTAAVAGKAVPAWLHDVFLGYGDPKQAHYRSLALEGQVIKQKKIQLGGWWNHLQAKTRWRWWRRLLLLADPPHTCVHIETPNARSS